MHRSLVDVRRVSLVGAHNVRDLGGYPSRFGGSVRWARLYRADRLDALTAADVETLNGLGLVAIYDLRTVEERNDAPDVVASAHVPILVRVVTGLDAIDFASIVGHDDGVRFMTEMVSDIVRYAGHEIGSIVYTLADPDRTPMMFHCSAGKDRTGVVAAMILETLGVDRDLVLDDFELTERYRRPETAAAAADHLLRRGLAPEAARGALGAPRSMMATALRVLDEEFGGIERYLTEHGGIDRSALDAIRRSLLVGRDATG